MGVGLIIVGFVFLFNPTIHIIDIIPDFIGFYLIYKGLSKLSLLNDNINAAKKMFLRLTGIEILKFISIVFVFSNQSAVSGSRDDMKLALAFIFGILEVICFIPAIKNLFDGIDYLGLKFSSISANKVIEKKKLIIDGDKFRFEKYERDYSSRVRSVVISFYSFRALCSVLGELPTLQNYEHSGYVGSSYVNYSQFKPLFYSVLWFAVIIFGIAFLFYLIKYFNSIRKDSEFQKILSDKYAQIIVDNPRRLIGKNMKTVLTLFVCATLASFKFYSDGVNVIPALLSSIIVIAASVKLKKYVKFSWAALFPAVALGIISVYNLTLQYDFFKLNGYMAEDVFYFEHTVDKYNLISIISALENVLALMMFCVFILSLYKAVKSHIRLAGRYCSDNAMYKAEEYAVELNNSVKKRFILVFSLMTLNFIMAGLYRFATLYVPSLFSINSLITIVWIAASFSLASYVNSQMYGRMLKINTI